MTLTELKDLVVESGKEWVEDGAPQWAAALSYYTALAMAPLLILTLSATSMVFSQEAAQQELLTRIDQWVGEQGAEVAATVLEQEGGAGIAGLSGLALLIFGATGVFGQLQKALNEMWEVAPDKGGLRRMIRGRLIGFALVLGICLLLIASLLVRAVISGLPAPGAALHVLNLGITLAVFTAALAAVYRVLPDVVIHWKEVWMGALVTALLFALGQVLIGLYMGRSAIGSAYGAAGSLVALLVWIYYTALVLFFGAEFTQVWARRSGRRIEPEPGAHRVRQMKVEEEGGVQEG